jgi:hypothetical protein
MNLQLNPEQALALYELIVASTASSPKSELSDRLVEVKLKLQSSVVGALDAIYSTSNKDKFSSWVKKEQEKISDLSSQLENLKTYPVYASGSKDPDDGLHFPVQK